MGECSKGCVEPNNYFDMPIRQENIRQLYSCECGLKTNDYLEWKKCECKPIKSKGGKRKGAGRPKSAPTKTISVRVKLEHVEPIKAMIRAYLESN